MRCTEIIVEDHIQIRRALDVVDGMLNKLESGQRIEVFDAKNVLKFLREFADQYHQVMEDSVLYPALLLLATPDNPALLQFVSDHCGERSLVSEIEEALLSRQGMAFFRGAQELTALLRSHCEREESILSSLAERSLSKEQDEQIAAEFLSRRAQLEHELNFSRLERLYPIKPVSEPVRVFQAAARHVPERAPL